MTVRDNIKFGLDVLNTPKNISSETLDSVLYESWNDKHLKIDIHLNYQVDSSSVLHWLDF